MNFFLKRRRELGLTQKSIADRIGVSSAAVSYWERGDSIPRIETYDRIAIAYETTSELVSAACLQMSRVAKVA